MEWLPYVYYTNVLVHIIARSDIRNADGELVLELMLALKKF